MKTKKTNEIIEPKVVIKNRMILELGSLATGQFYEFQETRIKSLNRIRNIIYRKDKNLELSEVQEKNEEPDYGDEYSDTNLPLKIKSLRKNNKITKEEELYINKMFDLYKDMVEKEKQYKKLVESSIIDEPIYTEFLEQIKGIGPLMTAMLLYYFGYCEKAKYPSQLWSYAGLTPTSKFIKGESAKFNTRLRMICWRIGDSFIKQRTNRYRIVYDTEKARQIALMETKSENAPTRLGHADARARRKMVKKFLCDYYIMCKELTGEEISKPWIIDKGGHTHFDDIRDFIKIKGFDNQPTKTAKPKDEVNHSKKKTK